MNWVKLSARSTEGKAARRVEEAISPIDFDPSVFAYLFVNRSAIVQQRMFDVIVALIAQYATEYDNGVIEPYAVDAKRLMDTVMAFGMIKSHFQNEPLG